MNNALDYWAVVKEYKSKVDIAHYQIRRAIALLEGTETEDQLVIAAKSVLAQLKHYLTSEGVNE